MTRLIAWKDQEALDALRLGAVVLDRRGEVWQVLLVRHSELGPTRGWFRLGDTGNIYGAAVVANQGPLRILYDRGTDLPENAAPCSYCGSSTNDPESDTANPQPCPNCNGAGWFLIPEPGSIADALPIALAEAIDRTAAIVPDRPLQALLPPISLAMGMTVIAEPKPAYVGTAPRVRGRVLTVVDPLEERSGIVELTILDDGAMRTFSAPILEYSFRPVEDV